MLPEIYQNTSESSFLRAKTALGEKQRLLTQNCQDNNFIEDAEDALVDLIVTILGNRIKIDF